MRKKTILSLIAAALLVAGFAFAQHEPEHGARGEDHADNAAAAPDEHDGHGAKAHGEASEAEAHGGHGLRAINWTDFGNKAQPPLVAQILNFAILLGIFFYFGRKPVMEGLKARRDSVAKEIEEAQRMKKEADERAKMYQAKLAHLEEELATTKAALVEAGKGERDRIINEAEEKAERMVRDAKELLEQEAKQMRQDLVKETIEVAMQAAEEMLKQRITPADHERLADEYLATLIRRPSVRPPS
jgi:F-type H+-transporting ATPase subunit b